MLRRSLQQIATLEDLNLSYSWMELIQHEALAAALPALTRMQRLALNCCGIAADGAHALAATLPRLRHLRALELGKNPLGVEGVLALASAIVALSGLLTKLHLGETDSGTAKRAYIGEPGRRPMGMPTGHGPGEALAAALAPLTGLKCLQLGGNGIGRLGVGMLAPVLGSLTRLSWLSMQGNPLHQDGAVALAPAVSKLSCLSGLNLGGTELGDAGAACLAPALAALTRLTLLSLDGNAIGGEGAAACAAALAGMGQLQELFLGGNLLHHNGCVVIKTALSGMIHLANLNLTSKIQVLMPRSARAAPRPSALRSPSWRRRGRRSVLVQTGCSSPSVSAPQACTWHTMASTLAA